MVTEDNNSLENNSKNCENVVIKKVVEHQFIKNRHGYLAFISGVVSTLLVIIVFAGVYLFYLDSKLKHLVESQEHYFEQQINSFSHELFNQHHDDLVKEFNEDFTRLDSELQKKLSERVQTLSKQAVEPLAREDKEIQKTIFQANDDFIAKIQVVIRTSLLEDRKIEAATALKGLELAENLLSQGNPARATLFFSNALNKDPGNISILSRYAKSVFDWSRQQTGDDNLSVSLEVINETDRFLKNQAGNVSPQDISKLEEIIADSEQVKKEIQDKIDLAKQSINSEKEKMLLSKVNENLASNIPMEEVPLIQYIEQLQIVQDAIETISTGNTVITDELKNSHVVKVKIAETDLNVLSVLQLLEKNDDFGNKNAESVTKASIISKMSALNAFAQQLMILKPESSPEMQAKIDSGLTTISKKIEGIGLQSQKIASDKINKEAEINKRYMTVNAYINSNEALKALGAFQRFVSINAMEVNDKAYLDLINAWNTKIGEAFWSWQKAQGLRYDGWALNKLEVFHNKYKGQLGFRTDTHKIYDALLRDLGDIDSRLLSPMANRAYSEVFELFFKELNDAQKIKLPSQMAVAEKLTQQQF